MKKIDLAKIPEAKTKEEGVQSPSKQPKAVKKKVVAKLMIKKSVSISEDNDRYINKKSLDLTMERGKTVNHSEALRIILDEHEKAKL